jgi:hypothetical protein
MAGGTPRHFFVFGGAVTQLSLFVDESGDFGPHSDYYVVSLVLHEQKDDISQEITHLNRHLSEDGLDPHHPIHSGAAIRGEAEYRNTPVEMRVREFSRLFEFSLRIPVTFQSFRIRKWEYSDRLKLKNAISRAIGTFLQENADYLLGFDQVIVYYDNGQAEITDVLNTLFGAFFFDADFRRVLPAQYRLFQVADLCCTLELLAGKSEDGRLSRSDLYFFGSRRALIKNFLRKSNRKRFTSRPF